MAKKCRDIRYDPRYQRFIDKYYDNLTGYVLDHCRHEPTWQQMDVLAGVEKPGARVAVSSGHGCFGIGTPIQMIDGSVLPVEEVKVGHLLKGDDETPREVLSLKRGQQLLYRFTYRGGYSHVFNASHILHLADSKGEARQVTVDRWLKWPLSYKREYSPYRMQYNGMLRRPYPIEGVRCLGLGDYYGFTLDGNNLFQDADGFVLRNTGKSFCLAWGLDWHLRVFVESNAIITAPNIEQARSVIWKYLDGVCADMDAIYPWMRNQFIKETKRYYAANAKDSWYVLPKTTSKDRPENMAGQHNINLMFVCDEASGIDDAIHGVMRGALTEARNRYVMSSQPTRPVGHFAEAMTTLAKREKPDGTIEGIYDTYILNSEESPLVTKKFISEKLVEYGGHHSPEYQIKVLGQLPDNLEGFLISKQWCEQSQYHQIEHKDEWGWVLTVDVAEGMHRDSSVVNLAKVSGYGPERRVECVELEEYLDKNEKDLARLVASKYHQYPALTIAVDADGAGRTVILELEELGIPCERIHWGLPCHTEADKRRYVNQRAYAHFMLREGIRLETFKAVENKKFVKQASRLPYKIDERGRYMILPKEQMRSQGIKSPDISDTCCFFYLCDYIPCMNAASTGSEEAEFIKNAKALMEMR